MAFYFYYIFHFLFVLGVLVFLFYLIRKIVLGKSISIKIISFLSILILSNFPIGKYGLSIINGNIGSYFYQPCDGNFGYNCNPIENKWMNKQALLQKFDSDKISYHREDKNDILYRTFDFKWWMFWEYYTYYTTDVYELPLLPKECKKMN